MSDSVNDYGLGAPDSQSDVTPLHHADPDHRDPDPLATGLGSPDGYEPEPEEGTEFGLGADNTQPGPPLPEEDQPERHGLGS